MTYINKLNFFSGWLVGCSKKAMIKDGPFVITLLFPPPEIYSLYVHVNV